MHGPGLRLFGRHGQRRAELERLLATDTRDTRLLQQLSKLAEEEGDLETAARYQKMHEDLAPSDEGQARLGGLLAKAGDLEEAQAVWSKAAAGKSQSFRVFLAMDNLLSHEKPLPVLEITEAMLREDPHDWEATLPAGARPGTARQAPGGGRAVSEARRAVRRRRREERIRQGAGEEPQAPAPRGAPPTSAQPRAAATMPLERPDRRRRTLIRRFCKLDADTPLHAATTWSPADFGQARMAALGWLVSLADKEHPSRLNE